MLQKLFVSCLSATLFFTVAYPQTSGDSKDLQQLQIQAVRFDDEARQSQGNQAVFESMSKRLNIPVETLQSEKQSTGFGFGQVFIANALAQASGQNFDQIAGEFKAGKGWGKIAKENNLKLGKVVSGLKRASDDLKTQRTERMHAEHDANHGNQGHQQGMSRQHGQMGGAKGVRGGGHQH